MTGRLLIVDDEADLGKFIRRVAENIGFEVEVTTSARDFKRAYERFDPTVVTLDILMPDEDGIELIQWLAARGCTARIVIISASLQFSAIASEIGIALGNLSIIKLKKPVTIQTLKEALAEPMASST
jgi:DNA-binding response OmpR family regulator